MREKIKKSIQRFLDTSPSTKILFLFTLAIILAALIYAVFILLIAK
jgi:hypothetical protein